MSREQVSKLPSLKFIDAETVRQATPMVDLVDAIDSAFRSPPEAPERHHHSMIVGDGEPDATLLLMPAWRSGEYVGIKVAMVFPGANAVGLPAVQATYILSHGDLSPGSDPQQLRESESLMCSLLGEYADGTYTTVVTHVDVYTRIIYPI